MKILVSANTSWYLWNFRTGLLRCFLANGDEVLLLSPQDHTSPELKNIGCRLLNIYLTGKGKALFSELASLIYYIKIFIRERPDVYFGFTIKPVIYGSLAARVVGVPTVVTITGLGTVFIRPTWFTGVIKSLYRISLSSAARVFFQNQADKNYFVKHRLVRAAQTEVVPGSGVDLNKFSIKPLDTTKKQNAPLFLLAGRLLRDKGVYEYVEAARIVLKQFPEARFQLLGPTEVDNETAISAREVKGWEDEGIIEYCEFTDHVVRFLVKADCVVLPSYREGIPRVLLEASAIGRPVLAAASVGCVDVVEDRITGFLCHPRDTKDLASKMVEFIHTSPDQRKNMGLAGRKKVEAEFDEEIVIKRYLSAICEVTK